MVYIVLHKVFPSAKLSVFVNNATTAQQTMTYYRQKWEIEDSSRHAVLDDINKVNDHESIIAI